MKAFERLAYGIWATVEKLLGGQTHNSNNKRDARDLPDIPFAKPCLLMAEGGSDH